MRRNSGPRFASEAALCAAFLALVARVAPEWQAYAETAGWDILLVRRDGAQIGIQAKLALNMDVIEQAMERGVHWVDLPGPDFRAVLVPSYATDRLEGVAAFAALTVLRVRPQEAFMTPSFSPMLPGNRDYRESEWHDMLPVEREKLPAYVPDVVAGAKAPRLLSDWKIGAIRLALTIELRGYITRTDFSRHEVDHRRWVKELRIIAGEEGWIAGPRMWDFKALHPRVYEEIREDAPKWLRPLPKPIAKRAMLPGLFDDEPEKGA